MIIICALLFIKSAIHDKVMGQTQTDFTIAYAQSLSADYDLDLWPNDMVLVPDTL